LNLYRPLLQPASRTLSEHLEQLRATLAGLGGQLRESVASAVSRSAAEALRQALATLLRQPGEGPNALDDRRPFDERPRLGDPSRRGIPLRSDWGEPDHLDDWRAPGESRWDRRDASGRRGQNDDVPDQYDDDRDEHDSAEQLRSNGWRSALAAACRLLGWLLGRLAAPGARLLALGVGLASGLAVWLAGPPAAPGPLSALTDVITCGADALARLGTR
jgi:hypothetical protein